MLYSTVEIRPGIPSKSGESVWRVNYYDIEGQRENVKSLPQVQAGFGFYHYKRKIGVEQAFRELKSCMIDERLKIIENLTRQVSELQKLQLPKKKV